MVRASVALLVSCGALAAMGAASAGRVDQRVFYLDAHPRQCVIASSDPSAKTFRVVRCSNAAHNLEVFAVRHGGWGRKLPSLRSAGLKARSLCLGSYRLLTGHAAPRTAGWAFFLPDPGAETAKYGDRIVCGYRAWPGVAPLGRGWHVR
jgi:hypothetical protein